MIFGLVLFFGIRKGWFITKAQRAAIVAGHAGHTEKGMPSAVPEDQTRGELHGQDKAFQLTGTEIYQLHGDEARRA
jgi:hypothetical protein